MYNRANAVGVKTPWHPNPIPRTQTPSLSEQRPFPGQTAKTQSKTVSTDQTPQKSTSIPRTGTSRDAFSAGKFIKHVQGRHETIASASPAPFIASSSCSFSGSSPRGSLAGISLPALLAFDSAHDRNRTRFLSWASRLAPVLARMASFTALATS